jgi:Protein of unknown function (DUF1353)
MKPKRKAEFLSRLRYDDFSTFERPIWLKVNSPFLVYTAVLQTVLEINVGFESDGRSTPRALWNIVPPVGPALWAAVPHDKLYKDGGYYIGRVYGAEGDVLVEGTFVPILQEQADAVYRELMILKGFSRFRAWWSWYALRKAGSFAWNEHRRHDQ